MAQQPLGIVGPVGRERDGREADERRHVTRIGLQDFTKDALRISCDRRPPAPRSPASICASRRIREPRALEGDARIVVLTAGRRAHRRTRARRDDGADLFEHPPHFLACPAGAGRRAGRRAPDPRARGQSPGTRASTRSSVARLSGILLLIEQRDAQQPQAVHLAGELRLERAQPPLGGRGTAGAQGGVRAGGGSPRMRLGRGSRSWLHRLGQESLACEPHAGGWRAAL